MTSLDFGTHTYTLEGDALEVVEVRGPSGSVTLPTFETAAGLRRVRFRVPLAGHYEIFAADGVRIADLDLAPESTTVSPIRRKGRHLEDATGAPFLWLADTWWYALCDRLPLDALKDFARTRREQGYSVVQVSAGLLPEIDAHDPLGNLAGRWPWSEDFERLELAWWDAADERILAILEAGLVPAIVGGWSYYLLDLGRSGIERHWREIIARWSALPVVWCIAGEAGLPHYHEVEAAATNGLLEHLTSEWTKVARQVAELDPYSNVRTVHPCPAFDQFSSSDSFTDLSDLDLIWLQTGHGDRAAVPGTLDALEADLAADHGLPVINSEVCYEGIAAGSSDTLQRFLFWSHLLSGAAGHTYGAQGIWAFRRPADPGPGLAWGDATWEDAARLPGGRQLGLSAELLRRLDWQALRPSPQSISAHASRDRRIFPYAARSDDRLVAYLPPVSLMHYRGDQDLGELTLRGLEPGEWEITWWNPRAGTTLETSISRVGVDGDAVLSNSRRPGPLPTMEDWIVLAERRESVR